MFHSARVASQMVFVNCSDVQSSLTLHLYSTEGLSMIYLIQLLLLITRSWCFMDVTIRLSLQFYSIIDRKTALFDKMNGLKHFDVVVLRYNSIPSGLLSLIDPRLKANQAQYRFFCKFILFIKY